MSRRIRLQPSLAIAVLMLGLIPFAGGPATAGEAAPRIYVVDFLAASEEVVDINEAGAVSTNRSGQ